MKLCELSALLLFGTGLLSACTNAGPSLPPGQNGFINMPANPSPVATKSSFTNSDDVGKTFRAYFAQGADGKTAADSSVATYGIVSIKVVDVNTIEVGTTSGKVVTYQFSTNFGPGVDLFVEKGSSAGSLFLARSSTGFRFGTLNAKYATGGAFGVQNDFGFGHVSSPGSLSGSATYISSNEGAFYLGGPQKAYRYGGGINLTANFASKTISGTLFDNTANGDTHDVLVTLSNGTISGNEFTGTPNVNISTGIDPQFSASSQSGTAAGLFLGKNGASITGAFGGTMTTTSGMGTGNWTYSGSF